MTISKPISVTKAAKILGVTRQAAYIAMKKGRIPAIRCADTKKWLITVEHVQAYQKSKYSRENSTYKGELIFDKSKGLYSVSEAAKVLDVPVQKVYYAMRSGHLKSHRKGANWVINIDDIQAYEERYLAIKEKEAI